MTKGELLKLGPLPSAFKFDVDECGIDVTLGAPIPRVFGISKIIQDQSEALHELSGPHIEDANQRCASNGT